MDTVKVPAAAHQDILQFHVRVLATRGCVRAGSRRAVAMYRTTFAAASFRAGELAHRRFHTVEAKHPVRIL
jgi:hypothetical protein